MYGLLGLLSTSGENFKSTAPLEIYLLTKMVTCSILILPAVYRFQKIETVLLIMFFIKGKLVIFLSRFIHLV